MLRSQLEKLTPCVCIPFLSQNEKLVSIWNLPPNYIYTYFKCENPKLFYNLQNKPICGYNNGFIKKRFN